MRYTIEYWSNNASDAYSTVLTATSPGTASLVIGSNGDTPGAAPVGTFFAKLPADALAELLRAATAPGFAAGPATESANPGEVIRRLKVVGEGRSEVLRYATQASPPDAAFEAAERAALALAKLVRQHPKQALSAETTLRFGPKKHVGVTVTLTNVGVEALGIPHPDFWEKHSVTITLTALRSDVPLAQLGNEHQAFIELSKDQLSGATPSLSSAPAISIGSLTDLTLTFTANLSIPAGHYDFWLTLETPLLDAQGVEVVRAELVSKKQSQPVH